MTHVPWTWSATGFQMVGRTHEDICRLCLKAGLAGIEGAPFLFDGLGEEDARRIGELYRAKGLAIETFHLPLGREDDISSFYDSVRRKAVDGAAKCMRSAAAAGCRAVVQHPSSSYASAEEEGLDRFMDALARSLERLLPLAEELGIVIALENMLPGPNGGRLGSRPEHMNLILTRFRHEHLGFCLDTGHALVAGHERAQEFLEAMSPALVTVHLADNAGDRDSHLAPGRGRVDWTAVFRCLHEIGYSDAACIEAPPFDYGPDYSDEAWRGLRSDVNSLALRVLS